MLKHQLNFDVKIYVESFKSVGQSVTSEEHLLGDCRVCLKIFPCGTSCTSGRHVSVFLKVTPIDGWTDELSILANFSISAFRSRSGSARNSIYKKDRFRFTKENDDRGWHDMIEGSSWTDLRRQGFLDIAGCLHFRAWVKGDFSCKHASAIVNHVYAHNISRDLWRTRKFPDMVVVVKGGLEIPCHRGVLSTASDVLDRMLASVMQEGSTSRIELPDVSKADAEFFLEYLYSGFLSTSADFVSMLLLADMYNVTELLKVCSENLDSRISEVNIVEVLSILHQKRGSEPYLELAFHRVLAHVWSDRQILITVVRHILLHGSSDAWAKEISERMLADSKLLSAVSQPIFKAIKQEVDTKPSGRESGTFSQPIFEAIEPCEEGSVHGSSDDDCVDDVVDLDTVDENFTPSEGSNRRSGAVSDGSRGREL